MAEEEGRKRGCTDATVDTFSFQAKGFYEKMGYIQCGEIKNIPPFPPGVTRYFMRKKIDTISSGE